MENQVITREEAKTAGLRFYFTGDPCKHGHVAQRNVKTTACVECHRQHQRADREKRRAFLCKRSREDYAQRRSENPSLHEKALERRRQWYEQNKDRALEVHRRYREKNGDKVIARVRRYTEQNPHMKLEKDAKRRASVRNRIPAWFGEFDQFVMQEAADLSIRRYDATGTKWHVDHMIPLLARKVSGLHCATNLQVIPAATNLRKKNKPMFTEPGEWIGAL